jgi:hypothetical protein
MQTPSAKSNQEQAVNVLAMRIEPLNHLFNEPSVRILTRFGQRRNLFHARAFEPFSNSGPPHREPLLISAAQIAGA